MNRFCQNRRCIGQVYKVRLNKFMKSSKNRVEIYQGTRFDLERLRGPIRVQLEKKYINPESFEPISYQNHHYKKRNISDYIKSPFQKEQFLQRSFVTKTCPDLKEDQKIKESNSTKSLADSSNRSLSNLEMRENYYYLEQVVADLAQKTEFQSTLRYINRLPTLLGDKCKKIISRMTQVVPQSSNSAHPILMKIARRCLPHQNLKDLTYQQLLSHLQRNIQSLMSNSHSRRNESRQRVRQMKKECDLRNSKLQLESKELHQRFEIQKVKMKDYYEKIYLKIYEENNMLKREKEVSQKLLETERIEHKAFQSNYQQLLKQIEEQLRELRLKCQQLQDQKLSQCIKKDQLAAKLQISQEELEKLAEKVRCMQCEASYSRLRISQLQAKLLKTLQKEKKANNKIINLQQQVGELRNSNLVLKSTLQDSRKNSLKSLQFQLSEKSLQISNAQSYNRERILEQQSQLQNNAHKLQQVERQLDEVTCKLEHIRDEYRQKVAQCQRMNKKIDELSLTISQKSKKNALLDDEIQDLQERCQTLSNLEGQLQKRTQKLYDTLSKTKLQVENLDKQRQQLQIKVQYQTRISAQKILSLQLRIQELQRQQSQRKKQLDLLEKQQKNIVQRKQGTEEQISNLFLILVRMESDKLMIDNGLKVGDLDWVRLWWRWLQQTNPFGKLQLSL